MCRKNRLLLFIGLLAALALPSNAQYFRLDPFECRDAPIDSSSDEFLEFREGPSGTLLGFQIGETKLRWYQSGFSEEIPLPFLPHSMYPSWISDLALLPAGGFVAAINQLGFGRDGGFAFFDSSAELVRVVGTPGLTILHLVVLGDRMIVVGFCSLQKDVTGSPMIHFFTISGEELGASTLAWPPHGSPGDGFYYWKASRLWATGGEVHYFDADRQLLWRIPSARSSLAAAVQVVGHQQRRALLLAVFDGRVFGIPFERSATDSCESLRRNPYMTLDPGEPQMILAEEWSTWRRLMPQKDGSTLALGHERICRLRKVAVESIQAARSR